MPTSAVRASGMPGALAAILADAAGGRFPPADGMVSILPQPSDRDAGVISFTAHSVIFADIDHAWIRAQLDPGDLSAPLSAAFLHTFGQRLGRRSHSIDMLTCAQALPDAAPADTALTELAEAEPEQPRIARALHYRDAVRAWLADGGVVTIGQGVAGRWETSIEVDPAFRGRGLGARLAVAARHLAPAGVPLWAQIAPANAASVRAFLSAGFRPVGAEALLSREAGA